MEIERNAVYGLELYRQDRIGPGQVITLSGDELEALLTLLKDVLNKKCRKKNK